MAQRDEWTNERMKKVLARPFCPKCHLFLEQHDDEACDMRYVEDKEINNVGQKSIPRSMGAAVA